MKVTVGFCNVEVVGVAPAPKFHDQLVVFVDKSVNVTGVPAQEDKGVAEKFATGGEETEVPFKVKL